MIKNDKYTDVLGVAPVNDQSDQNEDQHLLINVSQNKKKVDLPLKDVQGSDVRTGEYQSSLNYSANAMSPASFQFDFSSHHKLGALSCLCKFLIYFIFIVLILALPGIKVYFTYEPDQEPDFMEDPWYQFVYLVYVPLLASFFLFLIG